MERVAYDAPEVPSMTRKPYTVSAEGKAKLRANAAHARKVRAERDPVDAAIKRLVERAPALTPEQASKIRALLASAPVSEGGEDA